MKSIKDRLDFDTPTGKFQFLTESYIKKNYLQLTPHQSIKLREKLQRGIYWVQIAPGGLIHWNWALLQDYVTRGDRPEHNELVESYLQSLPTAV
jgi:hypothetical protein